jgi:hypothetical protein
MLNSALLCLCHVCLLLVFVSTTGVTSNNVLHDRNVFICGFGESSHFASNFLQATHLHRSKYMHYTPFKNASSADVAVLFGLMPHCLRAVRNFTGTLIYLNNEAGKPIVSSYISNFTQQNLANMIYLGVPAIDVPSTVTKIPCIFGAQTLECNSAKVKKIFSRHINPSHKTRFLAYAATKCLSMRENMFDVLVNLSVLHDLGTITAYGACHGSPSNVNYSHTPVKYSVNRSSSHSYNHVGNTSRKHFGNNGVLFQPYKYVLAMENDDIDFYMTEKIFFAYQAGAIPLYWGASSIVHDMFHPDTFIYLDPANPQPALDRILEIERDPALYRQILRTPVLLRGEDTVRKYFAVGIPASASSALELDAGLSNASLSHRIWAAIIQHLHPLPAAV